MIIEYLIEMNMKNIFKPVLYTVILLTSAFLLTGCTPSKEDVAEYGQILVQADLLIEGKEYSSAMEKLNEATQLIPSEYDAYERIINILLEKNRIEDAKKVIDESANKLSDSNRAILYEEVGKAFYTNREYSKALISFELANVADQNRESVKFNMAKVYLQQGNIEKANTLLKGKFSEDLQEEANLIYSYIIALTDYNKAKTEVEKVQPSEEIKERYEGWISVLESLDEDDLYNRSKLANAYLDANYPYLAITILEPVKKDMTEYIDGLYLLGKAYYENGKYQESLDTLVGVTTLSKLNQYLYWLIARDYYMLDNLDDAFSYYDSAVSFAGDGADVRLYQEYLDLLLENNQTTKADEVLKKAETLFEDPWVDIYYIKLSYLTKQNEKTVYYSKKIEYDQLEGNYKKDYLYWKSKIAIENNELDEAKRTLDMYWELDKYDPRYNLLMGQLRFQEGNLEEARSYSKKSIEYDMQRLVTDDAQKLLARID